MIDEECGLNVSNFRAISGIGLKPTLNFKTRRQEEGFIPPALVLPGNSIQHQIWNKEERESWAKKAVYLNSIRENLF